LVDPYILDYTKALNLKANRTFVDIYSNRYFVLIILRCRKKSWWRVFNYKPEKLIPYSRHLRRSRL